MDLLLHRQNTKNKQELTAQKMKKNIKSDLKLLSADSDTVPRTSQTETLCYATVISDYNPNDPIIKSLGLWDVNDIQLEEGAIVKVIMGPHAQKPEKYTGYVNGVKGNFSSACVKLLTEEEPRGLNEEEPDQEEALELLDESKASSNVISGRKPTWFARYVSTSTTENRPQIIVGNPVAISPITTANPQSPILQTPKTNKFSKGPGQRMLWSDFVGGPEAVAKLNLSKQEMKRQEVIFEIIATECDYVQDLETILEIYIRPLQKTKLIRPKDMAIIFSNIEQFLPVNAELFRELEIKQNANPVIASVGEVLLQTFDYLKMYTMYCSNHPHALMKVQALRQTRAVSRFLDSAQLQPHSRSLDLGSFLLKPVQRVCKYPLLLRDLIKSTDDTHPDSENLRKAMAKIEIVVSAINEGARSSENVHKMIELQAKFSTKVDLVAPSRYLVKSATLKIYNQHAVLKPREVYLFNDMIVIAKQENDKYRLLNKIGFDDIFINEVQTEQSDSQCQIEIVHVGQGNIVIEFDSQPLRETWMVSIQKTVMEWLAQKKRINQANNITIKIVEDPNSAIVEDSKKSGEFGGDDAPRDLATIQNVLEKALVKKRESMMSMRIDSDINVYSKADGNEKHHKRSVTTPLSARSDSSDSENALPPHLRGLPMLVQNSLKTSQANIAAAEIPHTRSITSPSRVEFSNSDGNPEKSGYKLGNPDLKNSSVSTLQSRGPQDLKKSIVSTFSSQSVETNVHSKNNSFAPDYNSPTNDPVLKPPPQLPVKKNSPQQEMLLTSGAVMNAPKPKILAPPVPMKKNHVSESQKPNLPENQPLQLPKRPPPSIPQKPPIDVSEVPPNTVQRLVTQIAKSGSSQNDAGLNGGQKSKNSTDNLVADKPKNDSTKRVNNTAPILGVSVINATPLKRAEAANQPLALNRPVKSTTVIEILKTKASSTTYLYVIRIEYFSGDPSTIQKRYEDFIDFNNQLMIHFQKELDGFLPDIQPITIASVNDSIAAERSNVIQGYMDILLAQPPKISRSPLIKQFFKKT